MKYSREECLEALRKAAEEMGQPLRVEDYRESGCSPSPRTMHKRFGSWPNALREAGLMAREHGKNHISIPPSMMNNVDGYEIFRAKLDGKQYTLLHHRLLAVAEHGFDTVCGNDVHHRNGIPWDNRPENLEVLDKSEHARRHALQRDLERDDAGGIVSW